ncbi:hypothetical protein [Synechococcus sp. CBW1108]|uniref:hypothetical protein n=1 Tax=Synechococcus sp. CBW1108 TaxID=1353147 RepID=UPI0018CFAB7A|nr:hypothetical protein [Synechococcus sp. CBW1108]QPN68801.1 hypothetical protein H8F27_08805 [Synechococcus sp. CBW1108]
MAGERKGLTYEAIVRIALDKLATQTKDSRNIFWNAKPASMTIEPDFTIGQEANSPDAVILVTHSGSAKDSEKKFWRNLGELVEAKTRLLKSPLVYSIAFDSVIKEDLKQIQACAFDGQLVVGDHAYGSALLSFVSQFHNKLPKDKDDKVDAIKNIISDRDYSDILNAILRLSEHIADLLIGQNDDLQGAWELHKSHVAGRMPMAHDSLVRRGMLKAALLGEIPDHSKPMSKTATLIAQQLRLARKEDIATRSIVGSRLADKDLVWLSRSNLNAIDVARLVEKFGTQGFQRQLIKLRSVALLPEFLRYTQANRSKLITPEGMKAALQQLHKDPSDALSIQDGIPSPSTVWMYDFIAAVVKARSKRAQDFGYSTFAKSPDPKGRMIGNMDVGTWCSCFMNQYFNRSPNFSAPPAAIEHCASILAGALASGDPAELRGPIDEIREQYINKELEVGLLTHRGFDPVGSLIIEALEEAGLSHQLETCPGIFAERARCDGRISNQRSGSTTLLRTKNTLVNWQSAHDSHTNDKRKELCGRISAIRYSWNPVESRCTKKEGIDKFILVVDGTWCEADLQALAASGWDEIYYPDEVAILIKAIV